jgi:hypothetical protein
MRQKSPVYILLQKLILFLIEEYIVTTKIILNKNNFVVNYNLDVIKSSENFGFSLRLDYPPNPPILVWLK